METMIRQLKEYFVQSLCCMPLLDPFSDIAAEVKNGFIEADKMLK